MADEWSMEHWRNATDRGRLKYLGKFDIQRTVHCDIFL